MTIRLYDLAAADPERRFSPYCWRTKLALAHKGLAVETVPWRFTEKSALPAPNEGKVPVIVDQGRVVHDSWAIAAYLEDTYPERPPLFGGAGGRATTRFVNSWADSVLGPAISRIILADLFHHLDERDKAYFRKSREERFGVTLEALCADREQRLPAFRQMLQPLRLTLSAQRYLGGETPAYADYIVFANFQWARVMSPFRLLEAGDPIHGWRERLLDAFGGLARNAPGFPA